MTLFTVIVAFFCTAFAAIVGLVRWKGGTHSVARHIRDVEESRNLLRHSTLESRAGPNQRLVTAFGIDNAFTTTDPAYCQKFVRKVKDLMRMPNEWSYLTTIASDIIRDALATAADGGHHVTFSLMNVVQAIVFRVVVFKFFSDAKLFSDQDIEIITTKINAQWLTSKSQEGRDQLKLLCDREELLQRVQFLVNVGKGDNGNAGRDNPLNIILPAYEALWRAVLSCFLEVRFRADTQDFVRYNQIFKSFLANPNLRTFEYPYHDSVLSVKNIVDEALRLYPPTKRIYRQTNDGVFAVDVEHLHRDPEIWGADALKFLPSRWIRKKVDKSVYIPFGMGRFECPAKNSFGPMMIGVLVGELVAQTRDDFDLVGVNEDTFGPEPLHDGRNAHAGLRLRRILL